MKDIDSIPPGHVVGPGAYHNESHISKLRNTEVRHLCGHHDELAASVGGAWDLSVEIKRPVLSVYRHKFTNGGPISLFTQNLVLFVGELTYVATAPIKACDDSIKGCCDCSIFLGER